MIGLGTMRVTVISGMLQSQRMANFMQQSRKTRRTYRNIPSRVAVQPHITAFPRSRVKSVTGRTAGQIGDTKNDLRCRWVGGLHKTYATRASPLFQSQPCRFPLGRVEGLETIQIIGERSGFIIVRQAASLGKVVGKSHRLARFGIPGAPA